MAWTVALVFVVTFLTQLLASGFNVFDADIPALQAAVQSGIAAVAALIINAASPWIKQYGVGADSSPE